MSNLKFNTDLESLMLQIGSIGFLDKFNLSALSVDFGNCNKIQYYCHQQMKSTIPTNPFIPNPLTCISKNAITRQLLADSKTCETSSQSLTKCIKIFVHFQSRGIPMVSTQACVTLTNTWLKAGINGGVETMGL